MQFDDFYEIVGVFGRYQKVKYLMICLAYMLPPIMVYTWVFTAATPSFRCRILVEEMSDVEIPKNILSRYIPSESQCRQYKSQISISECQRCYQNTNRSIFNEGIKTPLKSCNSFVFDRTYYQSTLVEEWSMVCNQVSLKSFVQTIFFFGYMIGSLVFGILSDRYGRRPIMGISFCIISVASFICAIAPQENLGFQWSYALFILGRFLLACASRGVALTGFVIGVEIVGPKQRLFTGIVVQYFFAIGQLLLLVFAFVIRTWRLLHMALAILSLPFLFFYFLLSESPRWLISKGYYDEAEKILRQIAKTNNNNFDSIAYQRLVTEEKKKEAAVAVKGHGLKHLLKSKVMCIISINMSIQWFVQNLVYYGVSQSTGQHALMFIAHITMKFFATGSYAIIYIYANELFPTNARNTGIGICSMIARTGAIVGTLSNDHLSRVWLHFPVVVFGFTSILAVALIAICPETFNKPLPQTIEDVEEMGLSFLCTNSKPLPCPHVEDNDDMDENKLLNKQSKNNVV
ncbi:unnamed protein product [Rotaria socialis]|uniref:Major facilitator superfamily (MFS) profile domain-containing protein n=1 Tax=Rotaria socialis TaxID=392032 RepID=A0A821SYJ9_9BILA|nr:unnamed protein product [Rotaria socialis]